MPDHRRTNRGVRRLVASGVYQAFSDSEIDRVIEADVLATEQKEFGALESEIERERARDRQKD